MFVRNLLHFESTKKYFSKKKKSKISNSGPDILNQFLKKERLVFLPLGKYTHAFPEILLDEINILSETLRVLNFGIKIGEIIRDKLVPDHSMAMSNIIAEQVPAFELNYEQAIQYLKKKDLRIETDKKGWALVTFQQHPLGWVNVLANRVNNYYPKELRILKD
jgi:NOL1/NOP2/fmu family ribosome biogenesis protein